MTDMTPKQNYDAMQAQKRRARMAEDERWEATQRKEKIADEAITAMLGGVKAFFDGNAKLKIEPNMMGIGHLVSFVKDATPGEQTR